MRPSGPPPILISIQQVERAIVFACLLSCCRLALFCCASVTNYAAVSRCPRRKTSASWGCSNFAGSPPLATPRRETFLSDLKSEKNRSGAQDSRQRSRFTMRAADTGKTREKRETVSSVMRWLPSAPNRRTAGTRLRPRDLALRPRMRTALSLRGRIAHTTKLRAPRPARHRAIFTPKSALTRSAAAKQPQPNNHNCTKITG